MISVSAREHVPVMDSLSSMKQPNLVFKHMTQWPKQNKSRKKTKTRTLGISMRKHTHISMQREKKTVLSVDYPYLPIHTPRMRWDTGGRCSLLSITDQRTCTVVPTAWSDDSTHAAVRFLSILKPDGRLHITLGIASPRRMGQGVSLSRP